MTSFHRESATIIEFSKAAQLLAKTRGKESRIPIELKAPVICDAAAGGWYHDEAISDANRDKHS